MEKLARYTIDTRHKVFQVCRDTLIFELGKISVHLFSHNSFYITN